MGELAHYPAHTTFVASWTDTLDARFAVDSYVSGCVASVFDLIFKCAPTDGAFLLKYRR